MAEVVALLTGLVAGVLLTWALVHRAAVVEAEGRFSAWRADETAKIRRGILSEGRGEIKQRVADGVGPTLTGGLGSLPFVAADARFIGDPVTFVVFDGHTEVKDRSAPALRAVSFLTVPGPDGGPGPDAVLVAECLADRRVGWLTVGLA